MSEEKSRMARNRTARRISKNLIKKYGFEGFIKLLTLFQNNVSGQRIGDEFGVTRQRACQWRKELCNVTVLVELHPEVAKMVNQTQASITI